MTKLASWNLVAATFAVVQLERLKLIPRALFLKIFFSLLFPIFLASHFLFDSTSLARDLTHNHCLACRGAHQTDLISDSSITTCEISKNSNFLNPQPSTDTKRCVIQVGKVTYSIPRNYLVYFDIPTIKVNFPEMEPLTDHNKQCFGSVHQAPSAGCEPLEFHLNLPFISHDLLLERKIHLISNKVPRRDSNGFDVYDIGPENARDEVYTMNNDFERIVFDCQIFKNHGNKAAVCTDNFTLTDGNTIHFFINLEKINEIPQIEARMRSLMESFRIKGAN